jgi:hypothetical protein
MSDETKELLKIIAGLAFWASIFCGIAYCIHDDNVQSAILEKQARKEWSDWVVYRDANCRVVEKMYGFSESSGKFHQDDNATVYDCGGMKYVVSESVEDDGNSGTLRSDAYIPKFDKK